MVILMLVGDLAPPAVRPVDREEVITLPCLAVATETLYTVVTQECEFVHGAVAREAVPPARKLERQRIARPAANHMNRNTRPLSAVLEHDLKHRYSAGFSPESEHRAQREAAETVLLIEQEFVANVRGRVRCVD